MKTTLRSLALVTSCLAFSACSDASSSKLPSATAASEKAAPKEMPVPKAEAVKPLVEALTATAPAQPASVADGPSAQKLVHAEPSANVVRSDEVEISHTPEPEVQQPSFDRPLQASEVKVDRFVLASGVEQREPVGETDVFDTEDKKIFAFVQLANAAEPYTFEVHFESVDGPTSRYGVKLQVPTAVRYRTWAWTQIRRSPGKYRAVLRTLEGEEIASREFTIEPSDAH